MPDATVDRLTARRDQLTQQDARYFVLHIDTYLSAIDSEPRARRIVRELRRDSDSALEDFKTQDQTFVEELASIRDDVVRQAPEIAPGNDPPRPDGLGARVWTMDTISGFDIVAANEVQIGFAPMPFYPTGNPGRTQELIQILRGRISAAEHGVQFGRGAPAAQPLRDLSVFRVQLENVQARYISAKRDFERQQLTLPGLADERLRLFVESLNPAPFLQDLEEAEDDFAERAFLHVLSEMGARGILRKAADGDALSREEQRTFDRLVDFLRGELDRLHVELVERLGLEQRSFGGWIRSNVREAQKKVIALWVGVTLGLIATGSVVYAENWIWHHAHHSTPPAGSHSK